jgi:hypothetical protein
MNVLQKLRRVVGDVRAPADPMRLLDSWALAERLLVRLDVDADEAGLLCATRDIDGLDALVGRLEAPGAAAPAAPPAAIPPDTLDHALRAFRKRLKVMRLADESRLAGRRLTSGRVSEIDAIQPPTEFPPEVWRALAASGRLVHTGGGFYSLPPGRA